MYAAAWMKIRVVGVEETLLLAPVGVHVRVVAVKDDVPGSLTAVGQDEHCDEHLLHAEKVLVGDHVLESAHRGRGAQLLVQGAGVDGKLHHRVAAHAVAVVHVLVAQANLEDAGHENLRKTVTHQVGSTAVVYATGKLGSQSQVLLLLPEHQQAAVRGKAHSIGRSLDHEVFYGGEVKFLARGLLSPSATSFPAADNTDEIPVGGRDEGEGACDEARLAECSGDRHIKEPVPE